MIHTLLYRHTNEGHRRPQSAWDSSVDPVVVIPSRHSDLLFGKLEVLQQGALEELRDWRCYLSPNEPFREPDQGRSRFVVAE
jgi:hypothetical protein